VNSSRVRNTANDEPSPSSAGVRKKVPTHWVRSLPLLAVLLSCAIYAVNFFFGGGSSHLILDSFAYLQLSDGQQASVPFNSRIATPFLAAFISSATGLSTSAAFKLLTPAALLTSLLLLRRLIRRRGGSAEWQAALLLAFGCSLAVTFGYTPVLVDPILLLLTCLTLVALDAGHLLAALVLAFLAALTKEYGVLLGVVWGVHAYRRGFRKVAYLGLILPAAALLIVLLVRQSNAGVGFGSWPAFAYHLVFEYQLSVFRLRGPVEYSKLLYMWSWCALWPVIFISTSSLLSRFVERIKMTDDEVNFGVLLTALPILLLVDWSRLLIIIVPFACIVATAHPLARDRSFVFLLAIGGLSTALARPFHSETPPPLTLTLTMTVISIASALLIAVKTLRFIHSGSSSQLDPV
jgi:hypothetical protein